MKETTKDFIWEYSLRLLLISIYPLWLLLGLFESSDWENFKDGAKLPFQKWGTQTSSNKG